ncbi:uncharacterized protein [Montipora capricornis]|uniref:uncharacterized protein n=1 Tax=Montipora capricornis TaxID=246305 RepID=UPI0035F158C4
MRRNRRMFLMMTQINQVMNAQTGRRAWVWPCPQNWFRYLIASPGLNFMWKEHFRVTRETFEYLCDLVRVKLQKQHTRFRIPISVEERVGLALWRLATGNSYRNCGLQFGFGKSTAKFICSEFEQAILELKEHFIKFPLTNQEIREKIEEFEELYGIPQIIGCHNEINAPPENHGDYFNRKQHYSVNLQGIVDANLKFIHATVGYPGSIHDARVLRLSGLHDLAQNEQILSGPIRNINGTEIGPLLAGDSAYPLMNWLLKPFADRGRLTPEQRKFNLKFSALQCVVERTFGMLKSCWRIMLKKIEQKTKTLKKTVIAACVLHNICIEKGDLYDADESDSDDNPADENGGRNALETGNSIPDTLKDYVWENL